jgi:hypothetical protein
MQACFVWCVDGQSLHVLKPCSFFKADFVDQIPVRHDALGGWQMQEPDLTPAVGAMPNEHPRD